MRPFVLGAVLGVVLSGCVTYERRALAPPAGTPELQAGRLLTADEAANIAFRLCQDRALRVDRVKRARLDEAGRWHLTLAGFTDRARVLLDGRDGKLLRGRFYREDSAPPGPSPSQYAPAPPRTPPPEEMELE